MDGRPGGVSGRPRVQRGTPARHRRLRRGFVVGKAAKLVRVRVSDPASSPRKPRPRRSFDGRGLAPPTPRSRRRRHRWRAENSVTSRRTRAAVRWPPYSPRSGRCARSSRGAVADDAAAARPAAVERESARLDVRKLVRICLPPAQSTPPGLFLKSSNKSCSSIGKAASNSSAVVA